MSYPWGMPGGISRRLKYSDTDSVEAELWIGGHTKAPSSFSDPQKSGYKTLFDYERETGDTLPFILKLLAVDRTLSIQAHPTKEQAERGYESEQSAGIPITAAERNYQDVFAKPEILVALDGGFDALCGFRQPLDSVQVFENLSAHPSLRKAARDTIKEYIAMLRADGIAGVVAWALAQQRKNEERAQQQEALKTAAAEEAAGETAAAADSEPHIDTFGLESDELIGVLKGGRNRSSLTLIEVLAALQEAALTHAALPVQSINPQLEKLVSLLSKLNSEYPGDAGIILASLLNNVTLQHGEALWIPPGTLHSYMRGYGIEIMGPSDNVLRGGLTEKHIDPKQLSEIIDFNGGATVRFAPETKGQNFRFAPDKNGKHAAPFELVRVLEDCEISSETPLSVFVVAGEYTVSSCQDEQQVQLGESVFVPSGKVTLKGAGEVFVATGRITDWS